MTPDSLVVCSTAQSRGFKFNSVILEQRTATPTMSGNGVGWYWWVSMLAGWEREPFSVKAWCALSSVGAPVILCLLSIKCVSPPPPPPRPRLPSPAFSILSSKSLQYLKCICWKDLGVIPDFFFSCCYLCCEDCVS